ncbi:MAG TPA: isochorismatase family protein [Fredinandcohnia sp.]|nr:isochorismatase family protein [Fredinandcohnia sp.]
MDDRPLGPEDALLIVDVQKDFCPGGALAVEGGDEIIPVLNAWVREAVRRGALVAASRDWHPPDHVSFHHRGGPWPPHCIRGTEGAEFHPDLELPKDAVILSKAEAPHREANSAFDGTGLAELLRRRGVRRVFVGGLTQDVCVRATALDALDLGLETVVLLDATRPVDPDQGEAAAREMEARGAKLLRGTP